MNAHAKGTGKWNLDNVWRYPLPENLGLTLDVDRCNVVQSVESESVAAKVGLLAEDRLVRLNGVPIHSFADAQFGLDLAPKEGAISVTWRRGEEAFTGVLALPRAWRKTEHSWRRSMQEFLPNPGLAGEDLSNAEKRSLGLSPNRLAFRQTDPVGEPESGILPGDVILGVDGLNLEMEAHQFRWYLAHHDVVGEQVHVDLFRDGKRRHISLMLAH